jgi:hypothetical protein
MVLAFDMDPPSSHIINLCKTKRARQKNTKCRAELPATQSQHVNHEALRVVGMRVQVCWMPGTSISGMCGTIVEDVFEHPKGVAVRVRVDNTNVVALVRIDALWRLPCETSAEVQRRAKLLNKEMARTGRNIRHKTPQQMAIAMMQLRNGVKRAAQDIGLARWVMDEDPRTFKARPDTDGRTRCWGVDPCDARVRHMGKRLHAITGRRNRRTEFSLGTIGAPETQFCQMLADRRLAALRAARSRNGSKDNDVFHRVLSLRVQLRGVSPPVYRDIDIMAGTALRSFVATVLVPCFGLVGKYHVDHLIDYRDGALYADPSTRGMKGGKCARRAARSHLLVVP